MVPLLWLWHVHMDKIANSSCDPYSLRVNSTFNSCSASGPSRSLGGLLRENPVVDATCTGFIFEVGFWMLAKPILTSSAAQGGGGSSKDRRPINHACMESEFTDGPKGGWGSESRSPSLSLSLSLSVFIYLSAPPSVYLSLWLSISLTIYFDLFLSTISFYPSLSLSLSLTLSLSLPLPLHPLPMHRYIHTYIHTIPYHTIP